jgi:biopolymer transport protein TolR
VKPVSDFRVAPRRRLLSEINVVPYIDVMLVLLVVFMITAPMMNQGIDVELPEVDAPPLDLKQTPPVLVNVLRDGSYRIDIGESRERKASLDDVTARVGAVRRQQPDTLVLVEGDEAVAYGKVVALMGALQRAGIKDVGLVTEPAEPERR